MIPPQTAPTQIPPSMQGANPQSAHLQLHDIHLPEQVSSLPTALGWWLLAAAVIITLFLLIKKYKNKKKLNQSKNHALSLLKNPEKMNDTDLISLVKWSAMQYFNRQQVAKLYGESFQQFLTKQLPEKYQEQFIKLSNQSFLTRYQATPKKNNNLDSSSLSEAEHTTSLISNSDCRSAVTLWLTYALPPINQKHANEKHTHGGLAHD